MHKINDCSIFTKIVITITHDKYSNIYIFIIKIYKVY